MTPYHLLTSPSVTPLTHRSPLIAAIKTALHTSNYTKSTADGRAIAWRHYWTMSIFKHLPRNYCTLCKTIARRVHCPDRLSAFVCRCYYYAAVWWRHRRRAPTGSDRTLVTNDTHTFSWIIYKFYVYGRWRFKVKHEHQFNKCNIWELRCVPELVAVPCAAWPSAVYNIITVSGHELLALGSATSCAHYALFADM